MSDQLKEIAARVQDLRDIAGVTQEQVATDLGLPLETYAAYESGESDIPVSVLYQIASRFGVELTALLTGEEPRLHSYCLVRQRKGVEVERRQEYGYQSLAYNFSHKKAEPFLVTVEPKPDQEIHLNSHPGQEFNYVLEGTLKLVLDGHELILNAGDSLYFDSSLKHGMMALGGTPTQFLAIIL